MPASGVSASESRTRQDLTLREAGHSLPLILRKVLRMWSSSPSPEVLLIRSCWLIVVPVQLIVACNNDRPGTTIEDLRDDGPVSIWRSGEAWQIEPDPEYVIGSVGGPAAYTFVRVRAAMLLSSGDMVVLDAGTRELKFYDRSGRFVRAVGGRGNGPGEFELPWSMVRTASDTLIVADPMLRRVSVLDEDGSYVRSFTPEPLGDGDLAVLGVIDTDRVLIRSGAVQVRRNGLVRDTLLLGIMSLQSGKVTVVARLPDQEMIVEVSNASGLLTQRDPPFGRFAYATAGPGVYYAGISDQYQINQYSIDGRTVDTIVGARSARAVSHEVVWKYLRATVAEDRMDDFLRRVRDPLIAPPSMPVFDGLIVDPDRNLWVRLYSPPWGDGVSEWDVHDPAGQWLGTIKMPSARTRIREQPDLLEVGSNHVLVLQQDSFDVLHVAKYRLVR
jgi:hypothetical protein